MAQVNLSDLTADGWLKRSDLPLFGQFIAPQTVRRVDGRSGFKLCSGPKARGGGTGNKIQWIFNSERKFVRWIDRRPREPMPERSIPGAFLAGIESRELP